MKISKSNRISELDFLKAVMILLMVAFHIVYFGDYYTYSKQLVYTFHMPIFLIISGFLMKTDRPFRLFCKSLWWIFLPYIIMEGAYILMASILPIREHIENLTFSVFIDKLFLHPLGPYWYFHTMIICGFLVFVSERIGRDRLLLTTILSVILVIILSILADLVSLSNALYFLVGALLRQSKKSFLYVFPAKWLSIPLFLGLSFFSQNLDRATIGGICIVYFGISSLLYIYPFIGRKTCTLLLFIGRNTLLIVLFSPIFTILCKGLIPYFSFDSTRLLFLIVAVLLTTSGSLLIGWLFDSTHLSSYFFGKEKVLQ